MQRKGLGSKGFSMSGNSFQFDVSETQRREHLEQKLSTIDKKLASLRSSSSRSISAPRQDNSYTIDYMSPQITSCPHCFTNLPTRDLRKHMAKFCKEKMVICQEIGCGLILPQGEMKKHLTHGCKIAKQRRAMATTAVKRKESAKETLLANIDLPHRNVVENTTTYHVFEPEENEPHDYGLLGTGMNHDGVSRAVPKEEFTTCELCNERIRIESISKHAKTACRMRRVYCTNRHLGCLEEVPLAHVAKHLRCDCEVEKKKDELVAKSRQRYENVKCTGCAEMIPLMYLKKHEVEECANRKVPCRNHALGCDVMVRLKDRKSHEDVGNSIRPRSCLFFDGCDSMMQISEDDIPPPWTMEFWVFRPSLLESARCYIREVRRLAELYVNALYDECRIRFRIMETKENLKIVAEAVAREAALSSKKKDGRTDSVLPQSDMANLTMQLAGMIQGYEDSAVASIKLAQLYLVAMKTALAEIDTCKGVRDHKELLDINPEVDGVACRQSYKENALMVGTGKTRSAGTAKSEKSSSGINDATCNPPQGDVADEDRGEDGMEEGTEEQGEMDGGVRGGGDEVGDMSGEEREQAHLEGQHHDGGEFEPGEGEDCVEQEEGGEERVEADMVDIPPGYERIITNHHDFDWGPKLWKEWEAMVKDMLLRLSSDESVMRELRVESGLIREAEKKKKKKKKEEGDSAAVEGGEGGTGGEETGGDLKDKKKDKKDKKSKKDKKEKKRKIDKSLRGENKFSEVTAAIRTLYQGSEALSFSENAGIFMNMSSAVSPPGVDTNEDIQGHIGFCDSVFGVNSFSCNIPREQWTHVAVMCTVEPKKRVMLYCDGGLVSTIKDVTFDLPMQSIGTPHISLHSYVLDVRYWAKARSVPEIKLDMRCLLKLSEENKQSKPHSSQDASLQKGKSNVEPTAAVSSEPDLTGDGLVAWWTFEDGGWSSRVRDVSDHRFPTLFLGGKNYRDLRKTPWFEAGSMLPLKVREHLMMTSQLPASQRPPPVVTPQISIPLPSYLERNLCPFEVRRAKLAQRGRALLQEKNCPNGCDAKVRKTDLRFHLKFECLRRKITCRHHWCNASFFAGDQYDHETKTCALVATRDAVLERAVENTQVLKCTDCSAKVQARHMFRHMEQSCPYRVIRCPHADCGEEFPAHQRRRHLNYVCTSEAVTKKKWLIRRARERIHYPRPWGIELDYSSSKDHADKKEIEEEHIPGTLAPTT